MEVHVHILPALFTPSELQGCQAVVIDILRATTTILHALAAGVTTLIPCGEVEQARHIAETRPAGTVLLGGERHGQRIEGFDLDNSPLKYSPETVAGKTLVFTTTNGTRALASCLEAERILVGAFVNLQATIETLSADGRPVHLVCAGTDGGVTTEDVLFAGAVAESLYQRHGGIDGADDETQLALSLWQTVRLNSTRQTTHSLGSSQTQNASDVASEIRQILRTSRGGLNLLELGFDADIDRAAECNRFNFAAEFDPARNEIHIVHGS